MKIKAYAKINLALDVIKKRDDGYHELDMIMAPIDLYDILDIRINPHNELICNEKNLALDESNTIYQMIKLLKEKYHLKENFKVVLEKNIPMQAGLAGGSADAAATLKAIVKLCELQISEDEILALGKEVGADVPFCLVNKVSRVKGIGEKIEKIKLKNEINFLLVKPKSGVSTSLAFEKIDFKTCVHPNIDLILNKINQDEDYISLLDNTLEASSILINPEIKQIKDELRKYGFKKVLMSGSGSSVFAIGDQKVIEKAYKNVKNKYEFVIISKMID